MGDLQVGRLERVQLRDTWLNESSDFTPWLALAAKADPVDLVSDLNLKLANGALSAETQSAIKSALGSSAVSGSAAQKVRVQAAMLMVLSANLLGDWLRVKLDPQLRQL